MRICRCLGAIARRVYGPAEAILARCESGLPAHRAPFAGAPGVAAAALALAGERVRERRAARRAGRPRPRPAGRQPRTADGVTTATATTAQHHQRAAGSRRSTSSGSASPRSALFGDDRLRDPQRRARARRRAARRSTSTASAQRSRRAPSGSSARAPGRRRRAARGAPDASSRGRAARPSTRSVLSSTTLRSRTASGVTSTHSSGRSSSSAWSSESWRWGTSRTSTSAVEERMLVRCFSRDGVDVEVVRARVLADDHALVELLAGPDEQRAALLQVHQRELRRDARAVGDQRAGRARAQLAGPRLPAIEDVVQDARCRASR